jgi:hypothetical protein
MVIQCKMGLVTPSAIGAVEQVLAAEFGGC